MPNDPIGDDESEPQVVRVGSLRVDLDAVLSIAHECEPDVCAGGRVCCAEYTIWLDRAEMERVVGWLPAASEYARHLSTPDGLANVFEDLGPDTYQVDQDDRGLCVLAYRRGGRVFCSLHSAALAAGVPPREAKPSCCLVWPLALTMSRPPVLSVHADAFRFACNRKRTGARSLHAGIAEVIRSAFGEELLAELERALSARDV